jgi:hypothetical protein
MRLCALFLFLLPGIPAFSADLPAPTYTLHEWGVFIIPKGNEYAQQDLKREWQSFPPFFHFDSAVEKAIPAPDGDMIIALKPVIWLRADQPLEADIRIGFPHGRPMVWWPQATIERAGASAALTFKLSIRQDKPAPYSVREVPADHWLARLRRVPGDWLTATARASVSSKGLREGLLQAAPEVDSLVYYDGLVQALPEPIVTNRTDGSYDITFPDGTAVLDAQLIDRRDGGVPSVSPWIERAADARRDRNQWSVNTKLEPCDERALDKRMLEFVDRLIAVGLSHDEATAMLDVWKSHLFASDGLTIFYRIPQQRYDAMLPLTAEPKPSATVRVGLVVHTHLEPDLSDRLAAEIARLSDPATRVAASNKLAEFGGAAFPALRKAAKSAKPDVAAACHAILAAGDLSAAMTAGNKAETSKSRN